MEASHTSSWGDWDLDDSSPTAPLAHRKTDPLRQAFQPLGPTAIDPNDPLASRDREIARIRGLLSLRETELSRLREENLRLKERYLDL
jgi:hypothetical protein